MGSNDDVGWRIFKIVMVAMILFLVVISLTRVFDMGEVKMMSALLQDSCQRADVDQAKLFSLVDVVLIEKRISQKSGKFYIMLENNRAVIEIQVPEEVFNKLKIGKGEK